MVKPQIMVVPKNPTEPKQKNGGDLIEGKVKNKIININTLRLMLVDLSHIRLTSKRYFLDVK